jgi:uncharacterized protein (DUF1697 family)
LKQRSRRRLFEALGYEVATFIRSEAELIEIANYQPFSESDLDAAQSFNIVFLGQTLSEAAELGLMALRTEIDDLHLLGREIYWLCRKKQSESTISGAAFNKALRMPATVRGANTVKKMTAKYAVPKR